ncbi:MAG: site-specific DNA-methyltransferase [Planctomycetes bacterium]|jgi:DNA modification methylase|nr:site-specific DNA-methyltransferase [Planctomycetota bacterium]MCL4729554.1 hypothetical protein [Planctomycetota bacterium]
MPRRRASQEPQLELIRGDALAVAPRLARHCAQLVYLDPPFFSGKRRRNTPRGPHYDDRWPGGLTQYLAFLRQLVDVSVPLLSPTGLLALHLDWRASHHGRLELDRALGPGAFVNEIIWAYRTGGTSRRYLARKHDTICVYAAGPHWKFRPQREKSYLAHRYGFSNITIHHDRRGPYTLAGLRDVWEIPALRGNQREFTGYPTQKPLALLARLIECFSDPGDLVVDLCCGSGTTLAAALKSGRRAVGVDHSAAAIELCRERLGL